MDVKKHLEEIIKISDKFEEELYEWARESSSPAAAVGKIKRVMAEEWPDGYAANRDSVIKISLIHKEFEDVRWKIEREAMRQWPTNSEGTSKS
ncbi:MAG: hypothetical protein ACTHVN_06195 [Lactobacillus delbrueckii]|uniref:Uncharacterized protein n=1 Tax=Lactobacillus delbrueckii subsp. lactis TaxID=29397 RepID=A0A3G6JHM3_LACDL|nr:MAG: hypothetical protein DQL93_08090 [Lactobacillus delbrueckii subsp. lactis]AZA17249.1 MAG: hypothetical protein DQL93_0350 [Lactobacillus phage ViSo-2018b]AZA24970.1 MAG: hypothetical protein DF199_03475 [Lactobacillus delbrueckii subsp. lactis]